MSWREELKAELATALGRRDGPVGAVDAEETDDERREILWRTMATAGRVMKLTRAELAAAAVQGNFESRGGHTLTVGNKFLEAAFIMDGLAIKVRRETGVVDLLHVEDGIVVDGQRKPVGRPEMYFGRLVVEFARSVRTDR